MTPRAAGTLAWPGRVATQPGQRPEGQCTTGLSAGHELPDGRPWTRKPQWGSRRLSPPSHRRAPSRPDRPPEASQPGGVTSSAALHGRNLLPPLPMRGSHLVLNRAAQPRRRHVRQVGEEFGGAVDVRAGWKPSRPDTPPATGSPQGRPWKRRRARWGSCSPQPPSRQRASSLALQMPGPSGRRYGAAGDDVRSTALWTLGPRPPTGPDCPFPSGADERPVRRLGWRRGRGRPGTNRSTARPGPAAPRHP